MDLSRPAVIQERLQKIKEGLLSFFESSPHEALHGGQVDVYLTDLDMKFDVDEKGLACCELTLDIESDINDPSKYTIHIVLDRLRISRSEGCRSGNEYLHAVRYLIDEFFKRSNPVFEDMPIQRMVFQVDDDVASLFVIEPLNITKYMYDVTSKIANMEVVNGLDFHSMKLSELFSGYNPGQERDVSDFWSYVIREDLPHVYDGSVRVSRLASMVLRGVPGFERVPYELLCKVWYHHILPLAIGRKKDHMPRGILSQAYKDEHDDPNDPDYIKLDYEYPIELGVVTLLSRDDFKTWYMHHLDLSVCDGFGPIDSEKMDEKVRKVQETPFVDICPPQFQKYFRTIRTPVKGIVLQCMTNMRVHKRLTYYEYLQLCMLKPGYNVILLGEFSEYLRYVCRKLI